MTQISYNLTIKGKVQGVCYRDWTRQTAQKLGIVGWVKNLANGDVQAIVQGEQENVDRLIELCYKGPNMANVITIEKEVVQPDNFTEFEVLY